MYKVAYLGPVVGSILGWLSEVLKSILYRYKNTGLLGQVLDPLFADKQISVTLYTQACLAKLYELAHNITAH